MTTHTGTLRGGVIELDAPPDPADLPDGGRVRVTVEPAAPPAPTGPPAADDPAAPAAPAAIPDQAVMAAFERTFGAWRDQAEEVEEFERETRRLRHLTREEARRLRGEG